MKYTPECCYLLLSINILVSLINPTFSTRNVLLIVADDLRPALGCYGDKNAFTPNIDKLAKSSIVFKRAYAQQALCAPSRNSFLTSRRPDTLHLYDFYNYWRDTVGNFTTIPQYFKENGYKTYSIGKIFHPGISSNYTDDFPYSWSKQPFHPSTERYKESPVCPDEHGLRRNLVCPVSVELQPEKTLPDLQSLDEAILFLRTKDNEIDLNPFFLAVGFHKPHIPLKFPVKYLDFHPIENITIANNLQRPYDLPTVAWNPWLDVKQRNDIADLNIEFPFGKMPTEWTRLITQSYNAAVTYIDDLVGQLIKEIDMTNTIVVFTSDHGWSLGEHGEFSKFSNYDVATRIPLIIYSPDINTKKEIVVDNIPVELVDLFPSIVELAGLPDTIPSCGEDKNTLICTEGKSLVPFIKIKSKLYKNCNAFSQYPRPGKFPTKKPNSDKPRLSEIKIMGYSIVFNEYRYTEWVNFTSFKPNWNEIVASEMYNHMFDPEENINLVGKPYLEDLQIMLRKELRKQSNNNCFKQ